MHPRNYFGNGMFGKRIIKNPWRFDFIFYGICYKKQKGPKTK